MAPMLIFLTGAPGGHELSQKQRLSVERTLPEFQSEWLSLQRSWEMKEDKVDGPAWIAITPAPPPRNQHVAEPGSNPDRIDATAFLDSQGLFADAKMQPEAMQGIAACAIDSDLRSYLDTSMRLHELEQSADMRSAERQAQRLGQESHFLKMSRVPITHIDLIPSATYLRDIEPQTMTVNLVVAIVSAPTFRSIYTNVTKRKMTLLELVVGDDTRSGFGISIWLAQDKGIEPHLWREANALRQGQLVLFQNVALNSFKGRVYGQNVRRNLTNFGQVDRQCDGVKIRAVRDWMAEFVGPVKSDPRNDRNRLGQLPPDTQ